MKIVLILLVILLIPVIEIFDDPALYIRQYLLKYGHSTIGKVVTSYTIMRTTVSPTGGGQREKPFMIIEFEDDRGKMQFHNYYPSMELYRKMSHSFVRVYFLPGHPSIFVLENDKPRFIWVNLIMPAAFGVIIFLSFRH